MSELLSRKEDAPDTPPSSTEWKRDKTEMEAPPKTGNKQIDRVECLPLKSLLLLQQGLLSAVGSLLIILGPYLPNDGRKCEQ